MPATRTIGFLHVDVDGLWAVRRCYAKPERDTYENDPCWEEGVPRLQQTFEAAGTPASFFLVGRDLELDTKRRIARKLIWRGFEIGNHSYSHKLGLTLDPFGAILEDVRRADQLIRAIGIKPRGFRAPGYDVDARVHRVVRRMGYIYDASLLPTMLGPALRLVDAFMARRWQSGKRQFGRMVYGRIPRRPYFPKPFKIRKELPSFAESKLLAIPVGTTPTLHLPLTAATLFSMRRSRIRDMFQSLARRKRPVLLLLHAIDGVDCRKPIVFDNRRSSLGGFNLSGREKEKRLRMIVEEFARTFDVQRTDEFAVRFCGLDR